jgi:hypothetical protein
MHPAQSKYLVKARRQAVTTSAMRIFARKYSCQPGERKFAAGDAALLFFS